MELTSFMRKPFMVEAVEVTVENIAEIAKFVGQLRGDDDQPYIQVDRRLVPNVYKVYPGFWVTKMGNNVRCYSSHIFKAQFMEATEGVETLNAFIKYLTEELSTTAP